LLSRLSDEPQTGADNYSNYRVVGGYDNLFGDLASGLNIVQGQVVTHINWSAQNVEVMTSNGSAWNASAVVITLPLGVLKARQVVFNPDLPMEKWGAINAMGICDVVKLHLKFDKPVLDRTVDAIMDENELPPFWWNSSGGYSSYPGQILVGWSAGEIARHFITVGATRALEQALTSLRRLLKRPNLTPTAAYMTHWNDDPFTRGAYAYIPPGATDAPTTLAAPIADTLFFAGEATDKRYSTVHGAYRSGIRAATEVLKARTVSVL
jgi:monoamine oxidase